MTGNAFNIEQYHPIDQSPLTPNSTLPRGIAHQPRDTSDDHLKEENEDENQLDDLNIQDALIPTGDLLNTDSLETNSCEEEAECEQDSQSIDLSVSPIKIKESTVTNQSCSFDKEADKR